MAKRTAIALVYSYNENWIGGTYYIQNLVSAMHTVADDRKPLIYVFAESTKHYLELASLTGYPYLQHVNPAKKKALWVRVLNKCYRQFSGEDFITGIPANLAAVFPATNEYLFPKQQPFLYWIPDFQEYHLPHFFSEWELSERKKHQQAIVDNGKYIVFSSNSARQDFNTIYPNNQLRQFVLPFAVTHVGADAKSEDIRTRYQLEQPYFICSNQFWKHKNHAVVIEALAMAKASDPSITMLFTGKENDHRHPTYFEELKSRIRELGIETNARFLGFIPRADQLQLMQKSCAVVQPSLFEGWSTVVEDAKSMNIPVIASSIDVHKEQLVQYAQKDFFEPTDAAALATLLTKPVAKEQTTMHQYSYSDDVKQFGEKFIEIIEAVRQNENQRDRKSSQVNHNKDTA